MFNFSKDRIEETTDRVAKQSDSAVQEITSQVKHTANALLGAVHDTADQAQDKAKTLIQSLKQDVDRLAAAENAENVSHEISQRAGKITEQVKEEMAHTYQTIKNKTADTVQQHPIGTVLIAAGAGLLIGYLLGHKRHE